MVSEHREITGRVHPLHLKLFLSRGKEENALDDRHDGRHCGQYATGEDGNEQEQHACRRLADVEVMQPAPPHQDGQQTGNAAALARRSVVEHAIERVGCLAVELLPLGLLLLTVGHIGLGSAIGALHTAHFLLSAILFSALGTIVDIHNI